MAALIDTVMQNSTTQTISMTGTSAATANAFTGAGPYVLVEISSKYDFHMKAGENPTATTSDALYFGGATIVKKIATGDKVAVIKASGSSDTTVTVTQQV